MCGIWVRAKTKGNVDPGELLAPIESLRHRGPDGYGWFADSRVGMVHTRLSIIDLHGGAQPLESSDRRWVGVVNGELYDYEKIRSELEKDGIRFRTRSDSEVLLNLFASRGPNALAHLSGEFAFIFYDRVEARVCFGRDSFGVKPLFMQRQETGLTIASEMKALAADKPVFDEAYLKMFLARVMVPPRTCLKDVEHVLPGRVYTLNLKSGRVSSEIYASLPLYHERDLGLNDAIERLDEELRASVRRRLRADVEVGCYLSGGIDSAVIAAIAADLGAKPKAFTVGFSERAFDETTEASEIASDLGIEHSTVQLTAKNFMDSLIRSIVAFENPITNPHGAAKNLLSMHARKDVKVVLSGEGSDELFGGYSYLRMRKLKEFLSRHPRLAPRAAELYLARESEQSLGHLDGDSVAFEATAERHFDGLSPALFLRTVKSRWFEYLTGDGLSPRISDICRELSSRLEEEHPRHGLSGMDLDLWTGFRTDFLHYVIANVGDRQEMSNALEGRTPFLDPHVARVASRVPARYLIRGLTEKYVLRKVGAKYLTPTHHGRGKKPFFAPFKHLYLRENRAIIHDYVRKSRSDTPWLNWKNIDHLIGGEKRGLQAPLEPGVLALKLALFSIGVLGEKLRAPRTDVRGFTVPRSVCDLLPYRKGENLEA